MTEPDCEEVREAASEYALNILPPEQRAVIAAHLSNCPACREEVDAMFTVGARLLDLVPGTEPPLGFDYRVLARVPSHDEDPQRARRVVRQSRRGVQRHPRLFAGIATLAAAAALIFGVLGLTTGRSTRDRHVQVLFSAPIHQGARDVGEVLAYRPYDGPTWVNMMVRGATGAERVTCELLYTNGSVKGFGTFDLVGGSGSWGAPDWSGLAGVAGARLLGPNGQVFATATFPSATSLK